MLAWRCRSRRFAILLTLAMAGCGGDSTQPPVPVASVLVQPDSTAIQVGTTAQFTATVRDGNGNVLSDRVVTWSSSNQAFATVSSTGVITSFAAGRVTITASSEGKSDTGTLNVISPARSDLQVTAVQITQGVQAEDGSIPLVLNGNAAVVNVLLEASEPVAARVQVVVRLLDGNGALVRTDTALTNGSIGPATDFGRPSAQILVPATALRAGLRFQVEVDPRRTIPDDFPGNNVFPRTGSTALATVTVPPLRVRLVPIVLTSHNNTSATVTTAQLPEYLRTLQSVHPLGTVELTIGSAMASTASFGAPPRGGESAFWSQILSEIDLARITSTVDPATHWFGLVLPPAGFNFTSFGGFAYITANGQSTGSNTRTAAAVQVGWFTDPAHTRELFAHELGHNFGRRHSPCGGPANPDPQYPFSTGFIGTTGHDVHSWATGRATSAVTMNSQVGDIMGYCTPVWSSEYTYRGVLNFRGSTVVVAKPLARARTRVLIVRGAITRDRGIVLEPSFTLTGIPTRPELPGPYVLTGRAADGRILFREAFTPAELDHTDAIRPFSFAIAITAEVETALHALEVAGPGAAARVARNIDAPVITAAPRMERSGTRTRVSCADPSARGIAVLDEATGAVLASAAGAALTIDLPGGTALALVCSDGVRSVRTTLQV